LPEHLSAIYRDESTIVKLLMPQWGG